jgi:hypothetical protein
VGLERSPLSLVSTIEELLGRKSSGSCLESREYGRRNPSRWQRDILYPQKLAPTSPTSGGRSVGIVRSLTKATESFLTWNYSALSSQTEFGNSGVHIINSDYSFKGPIQISKDK